MQHHSIVVMLLMRMHPRVAIVHARAIVKYIRVDLVELVEVVAVRAMDAKASVVAMVAVVVAAVAMGAPNNDDRDINVPEKYL